MTQPVVLFIAFVSFIIMIFLIWRFVFPLNWFILGLRSGEPRYRLSAVNSLKRHGDKREIPHLHKLLTDYDLDVFEVTVGALEPLGETDHPSSILRRFTARAS